MKRYARQRHRVLQVITRLMVPFVLLFGLYVQFHGDYGPSSGYNAPDACYRHQCCVG